MIKINRHYFDQINLGHGGVIVTAKGNSSDFLCLIGFEIAFFKEEDDLSVEFSVRIEKLKPEYSLKVSFIR